MDEISDPCMGCIYQVNVGGYLLCDYLLMTGHCRPSPFGVECREKQTEINGGVDIHMAQWDQDRAKALIAQGMSDKDVAQIVGVTRKLQALERNVLQYADKLGLTPSGRVRLAQRRAAATGEVQADDLFGD